jgi:hypothetical protein
MSALVNKVPILLIITLLLLTFPGGVAAAAPAIDVPASIQAQAGQNFTVPVTIRAGSVPLFVYWLHAFPEAGHVTVESRDVKQTVAANASLRVNLIGNAHAPGISRVRIEAWAGPQSPGSAEVLVEVSDPAGQAARPRFSVTGVSFVPASPDLTQPFTVNISLHNIGEAATRNMTAALDGGENFTVTALTNTVHLQLVERGATAVASFQVRALDTRETNQVALNLSYGTFTQAETLNLPLPAVLRPPKLQAPVLEADSFTLQPGRDGRFVLSLTVRNRGKMEAGNIRVTLDGGDRLFPAEGGSTRNISALAPGSAAVVEYQLFSRGSLAAHPVNVSFDYLSPAGAALKNSDRIFISANREPDLKVTGFSASPDGDGGRFLLNLHLQNKGHATARDIAVRFTGSQAFPLDGSDLVLAPDLAAGSSSRISLRMMTGTQSNIYSIPVEITYRSAAGAEHKTNETIVLTAAATGGPKQQGTPRVMLERHTLSTDQVLAGGSFTLKLYVKNNAARPVSNIKISLGTVQVGAGAGGTGGTGGTVFSPLDGSSDSFFVESIAAKGRLVKEVKLFVDPNAAAMTYALPITIDFEDGEGKAFSVSETVNIPVLQESRVQVLSLEIPSQAVVGQAVPVSMEFANTGRTVLSNVLVNIEGDFPRENASYFLPRLEIGAGDFFQGMIIPAAEGTLSGNLAVTFLDGRNREVRLDHPFTLEVQPMKQPPAGAPVPVPGPELPGGGFPGMVFLWGGAAVVVMGIAAALIVRKRRNRRREIFLDEQA